VRELPAIAGRLTRSALPDGRAIRMQPMAVDIAGAHTELGFAPKYGQHTRALLAEAGLSQTEVQTLHDAGVVA
jgi:crotonobetainyl-CoA:carnitine CoA-transferase CaiB-like acyl-CoA transferase